MTNSPLVNFTRISPNRTSPRNRPIDTITIHCVVGQATVETIGNIFGATSRQASSNYGIGFNGRIGMYVEEKDRSWCSSSSLNDNRAITIEVASDSFHPFKVNAVVYRSLINLLVDICRRNNIKELKWQGDRSLIGQIDKQNMTVHRWFSNKSCPGDYLFNLHNQIANEVNNILNPPPKPTIGFLVRINATSLNYRAGAGINFRINGQVKRGEVYTIIEVRNGWGRLKSGVGWINLRHTTRL